MFFVVLCPGAPESQPAVVLVLKHLRRRATGLSLIRQTGRSRKLNQQPLVYKE